MAQDGRPLGGVGAACGGDSLPEDPHPITLAAPRPDHTRASNVYVETPFKHRVAPRRPPGPHHHGSSSSSSSSHHHHHHHHLHSQDLPLVHGGVSGVRASGKRGVKSALTTTPSTAATTLKTSTLGKTSSSTAPLASIKGRSPTTTSSSSSTLGGKTLSAGVVTKQPAAAPTAATLTFTKGLRDSDGDTDSIICAVCGKCRCEACRTPRPLPSRWLCQNKCLCSSSACVDYASCLCCVKGVLYHCGADGAGDGSGVAVADQPCACAGPHACIRWTCLASASVVLPCLLCYWPLRAATRVVELCYQKYTNHGCQCQVQQQQQHHPRGDVSPEKRLLQDCV